MPDPLVLGGLGGIAGLSSGLFGIGGALIATPLLRLAGIEPLLALATPLPAVIPTALSASIAYWRHRLIRWDVAGWLLLTGLPGTVLGALATRLVGGTALMVLTGALLLFVALRMLGPERPSTAGSPDAMPRRTLLLGTGVLAGFLGGLLAIGGGIIIVPALVLWGRMPFKQALATSLLCVAGLALPGTITHAMLGHIAAPLLLPFLAGSLPAAYLGAAVATRLSSVLLRRLYGGALTAFAVYFLWTQLSG